MQEIGGYHIVRTLWQMTDPVNGDARDVFLARRDGDQFLLTVFPQNSGQYVAAQARRKVSDEHVRQFYESGIGPETSTVHPHIVQTYPLQWDGDTLFVVAEYFDGKLIDDWIKETGPLSVRDVVTIGIAISEAMECAGHRDGGGLSLRRHEILVSGTSGVRITMFSEGLGDLRPNPLLSALEERLEVGSPGFSLGSFLAPEVSSQTQALGALTEEAQRLMRLHGFGQLLFEFLTQQPAVSRNSKYVECLRIHEANPSVPNDLIQIVDKLLEDEPRDRFQTFGEVAAALRSLGLQHETLDCVSGGSASNPIEEARAERLAFPEPSAEFDFRRVRWGMSHDEIREAETIAPHGELPGYMMYDTLVGTKTFALTYVFAETATEAVICVGANLQPSGMQPNGMQAGGYLSIVPESDPEGLPFPRPDPEAVAASLPEEKREEYLAIARRRPPRDTELHAKPNLAKAADDFATLREFIESRHGTAQVVRALTADEIHNYGGLTELTSDQQRLNQLLGWVTDSTLIHLSLMPFLCGGVVLQAAFKSREHEYLLQ